MQTELAGKGFLGPVAPSPMLHAPREMAACKELRHALRLAMAHAGMLQETLAARIGVTDGYMSMLLNGKRRLNDRHIAAVVRVTGSMAPLQFLAMEQGAEIYVDPTQARKAQLLAELRQIEREAAA